MLRNRSRHIDPSERQRKNRETELLILLEKCSQIAKDDRILLRSLIKEHSNDVIGIMLSHRRLQDMAELQIELRRYVTAYRNRLNENFEFCKEPKRATTRVTSCTSFQGSHRTRQSEPLQLRLTVDQNTGMIRKTEVDGRISTACQSETGVFDSRPSEATSKSVVDPQPTILRIRFEKEIEQEIDREIQRELEDLTIEEVKAEQPSDEPDESMLGDSFLQQFKPFEKTVCFSKGLKAFGESPQPAIEPALQIPSEPSRFSLPEAAAEHSQSARIHRQESGSHAPSKDGSTTNSLKANAHLWYQQFMQQHDKWKVGEDTPQSRQEQHTNPLCSSTQSDDPPTIKSSVGEFHKKGLSLNLNCLPAASPIEEPQLFSFRRECQREKEPEPRYGEFYKKLKKELESL